MKDTDVVDVVACDPRYDDNLVLVQRDGKYITLEDYISQKVSEQIAKYLRETNNEQKI
jgi:hypothetical protein